MKVLILKGGEELEVNESYGARLIEQGKAVVIPAKAEEAEQAGEPAAAAEPDAAPEAAEEARAASPKKTRKK